MKGHDVCDNFMCCFYVLEVCVFTLNIDVRTPFILMDIIIDIAQNHYSMILCNNSDYLLIANTLAT